MPDRSSTPMGFVLVLLCFFLSGFAALLYETAWTREFAAVFGTSELAVVSVLAAYMAGLAAGAAAAGRWAGRVRRPVLVYGLLELGIAASALAVPFSLKAATRLQVLLFGGLPAPPDEGQIAGALFYVVCAFVILVLPTGLMGATLPLLARHAVRRQEEVGTRIGALYALNTTGAVLGAMGTGYVLLPALGLRHTVYVGAAINALVFAAAALLARSAPLAPASPSEALRARFHWVLPLVAVSGVVSFSYEVLWTRLLGQVVGGSVQGFATMLASFLLGIALGSAAASRLARDRPRAARGFAAAQIGAAVLSLAAFAGIDRLPDLARALEAGRSGSVAANAAVALLGLLPGALCIGAVFPFAVRLLARGEADAAHAAARVYAWNTLGAIAGALACGFVLLPALHFSGTMVLAAGLNLALALIAASLTRPVPKLALGLALAACVWLVAAPPPVPWQVLRYRNDRASWSGDVIHLGVGRSATIMLFEDSEGWRLTSNGLAESRIDRPGPWPDRYLTARWLSLLPVLLRPDARKLLVVGLGGGHTVEAVPSSIDSIQVIELEEEVVGAHQSLEPRRGLSPLSDPRVALILNDARGALALTDARFDAIVSQPSHPWTAGASHLYTREFFALVKQRLEPGGVFVQWIGLDYADRALMRSLVATLLAVFPEVALFQPVDAAVLFAASDQPLEPLLSAPRALEATPDEFARYGLVSREDLAAGWVLDTAGARRFAAGAPLNTDDRNHLAVRSARLGSQSLRATGGLRVPRQDDPLARLDGAVDEVYLVRRLLERRHAGRALRIASGLGDPVRRQTALGWATSQRSLSRAATHFRRALARDPDAVSARFGLLRLRRSLLHGDAPDPHSLAEGLAGSEAAVVVGWQHGARHEWSALRALEPDLAAAGPYDPAYPDAQRLRVRWRAAKGSAAEREQAVRMASALLRSWGGAEDWLVTAAALSSVERPAEALEALDRLSRMRVDPTTAREALDVLRELPDSLEPGAAAQIRRRLGARLQG